MSDDLLDLTEAAAAGDRKALDALLSRYLPELRAFVRLRAGPLLRARESHSDLVQSVCREILEHQHRFRHPSASAFKQWLFATALRKIQHRREYWLAHKRDVGREQRMAGSPTAGDDEARNLLAVYQTFSTPSHQVAVREEVARIEAAFDALSEEQREVVTLAHVVGMSRAEIAARTGRSEGAVRVLLHRALARLSGLLRS